MLRGDRCWVDGDVTDATDDEDVAPALRGESDVVNDPSTPTMLLRLPRPVVTVR